MEDDQYQFEMDLPPHPLCLVLDPILAYYEWLRQLDASASAPVVKPVEKPSSH